MNELFQHIKIGELSQCQRLFHGRGHAYPSFEHINIDWFAPIALITVYQQCPPTQLIALAQWLKGNLADCHSVQVQHRWQKLAPVEVLLGEQLSHTVVDENGLKFNIHLGKAQNSGLFLDMRNGRKWVQQHAQNAKVLNLFSYTCAFSVAAIAGGAAQVVNVDLSKASLSKGRENHRLNQQNTDKVVFQGVDIFKSFGRLKKYGPYQLLIADPPSFQKGSVNIQRDYGKIIRRIPELLEDKGYALLCLNSPELDEAFLMNEVAQYCSVLHFVEKLANPEVFVEAHPGKGLKVLLFQYCC